MKKLVCLLLSVVLLFSLTACAGQNEEEARMERVLTKFFTCPDETVVSYIKGATVYWGEGAPAQDEASLEKAQKAQDDCTAYLKTVFTAEDMTEELQEKFCEKQYHQVMFPTLASVAGVTLTVDALEIELVSESSRSYSYTAALLITKEDGTEIPFTQEGKLSLSEDGRISWINVAVFADLTAELMNMANENLANQAE